MRRVWRYIIILLVLGMIVNLGVLVPVQAATPTITCSPTSGPPGTVVTLNLANFTAGASVTIQFDGNDISTSPSTIFITGTGTFIGATITIPSVLSNSYLHTITATASDGTTASATFLTPRITISPSSGIAGSAVTVSGTGFAPNENVTVKFNGTQMGTVPADSTGSWNTSNGYSLTFNVPSVAAGTYTIEAIGDQGSDATASYTVKANPVIKLNHSSGTAGTSLTVNGTGFAPNETNVQVTFNGSQVGSTPAVSSTGTWALTFTVPPIPAGSYNIGASGNTSTAPSVSFSVTPSISISPSNATPGTSVTVNGTGFAANEKNITVTWDGQPDSNTTTNADGNGSWSTSFTIPSQAGGSHTIGAIGTITTSVPGITFRIGAGISISRTSGTVGSMITVTGSGFAANEPNVSVTFDGNQISSQAIPVSQSGTWTANVVIPPSAGGSHNISAGGKTTTNIAAVPFTVMPSISVNKTSGEVGAEITVTGSGFAAGEQGIVVTFDGNQVGSKVNADNFGNWTETFEVPSFTSGSHTIQASGPITQSTAAGNLSFTVVPAISISPSLGYVGSTVNITGTGFASNSILQILYDGNPVNNLGNVITDDSGSFNKSITIPTSKAGDNTIKVIDAQNNTGSETFEINNTPPAAPKPISPADGTRIGLFGGITPTLEWSKVTDPNGITYEVQVDTSPNFNNPIVDESGITSTRYTLSKAEALPRGDYYWRVRAIDLASNESDWSQPLLLESGAISPGILALIIILVLAAIGAAAYFLPRFLKKRRQAVTAGSTPEIVIPEVINADYRTVDSEEVNKKKALPWRLALPQAQPAKGAKALSPEDQARLKVIVDFARSLPLVEPGSNTSWLIDMAENGTGRTASPALYSQLLKGETQIHYEPTWMRHPTYMDLRTMLDGQPILQNLNSFIDSVNRAASEAMQVLQDIYRDTASEVTWDIFANEGWNFISGIYTDAFSWFSGKNLREPSERDYIIKAETDSEDGAKVYGLYGEPSSPFPGRLILASGENEAMQLRSLHLKLRKAYRNTDKTREVVSMVTQLEVQRGQLLNAFGQFNRLNT